MSEVVKVPSTDEAWDTGALGDSAENAKQAPAQIEARVDELLDLQMISIRLPREMIDDYKYLSKRAGLKYQTLMKQALQRFAVAEMKCIADDMEKQDQRARSIAQDQPRRRRA